MAVQTGIRDDRVNAATVLVVVVCWLAIIFEGYDLIVYGTVVPSLLHDRAWSLNPAQAGAIGSYAVIGMLFGALIVGTLTDFVGRKVTLISCVTLFSLAMGGCALAPTPALFSILRFIAGLGLGGVIPTATAVTIEYAPRNWRTFTYTVMFSGYPLGGILASGLAIPLIPAFGWRIMFWIGVVPLILVVPVALFFLPESVGFLLAKGRRHEAEVIARRFNLHLDDAVHPVTDRWSVVRTLFTRRMLLATLSFWIATFLALFMIFGLNTWVPQIMRTAGYSLGSALSFLLVLDIGTIIGSLLTGAAMDRFGAKSTCIVSFLLAALSLGLLSVRLPLPVTYFLFAIAGVGTIGTQTLLNAYVSKYYPLGSRATALGWSLGIGRFGGILGPLFGGVLLSWGVGLQWNFYAFALPGLLGAIVILFVNDRHASDFARDEASVTPAFLPE
jgi:AAHS family benzoate transporter-like MFS transporter